MTTPTPTLDVTPLRPAVRSDAVTTLDVLLTVTPPAVAASGSASRPPLNLGIVLDRSGSMSERNKIDFAHKAAAFAVGELLPGDRVGVVVFDDKVDIVHPQGPAGDKDALVKRIEAVRPRNGTDLFAGWAEGAKQVGGALVAGGLNRVVLLSDGNANAGETRPDAIADHVHKAAKGGVGTTAIGLGDDYNEDLLEAMARSGDGNYYYVESPAQLPELFAAELRGLSATAGVDVALSVEPADGVVVADVLNDLDANRDGTLKLPNLVAGRPVFVVVRLTVPPTTGERPVLAFKVTWAAPAGGGTRGVATAGLTLPGVSSDVWDKLAANPDVQERAALLAVARLKKRASAASEVGDVATARMCLADAGAVLAPCPPSLARAKETADLADIDALIVTGQGEKFRKSAKHQAYRRRHSHE